MTIEKPDMYTKSFIAGWGDMDFNSHMRNTAFLDRAADVRMMFFSENGFQMQQFSRQRIGPVVMKDEVEYFREICLLQEFSVSVEVAGLSEDGSRFLMCNTFFNGGGKLCAQITSGGGWLNLEERKLVAPPAALREALFALHNTDDFTILPTSVKSSAAASP